MINKGVILKIEGKEAFVMSGKCKFVYIKSTPQMFIGQQIQFKDSDILDSRKSLKTWITVSSSIAAVFILSLVIYLNFIKPTANGSLFAYVDLDINPSIEFRIDQNLQVIGTKAIDEDAKKLLSHLDVRHMNIREAVLAAVEEYDNSLKGKKGPDKTMLLSAALSIPDVKNPSDKQEDQQKLEQLLISLKSIQHYDIYVINTAPELKAAANKNNLSLGMQYAIEKAREKGTQLTPNTVRQLHVKEIVQMIDDRGFMQSGATPSVSPLHTKHPGQTPQPSVTHMSTPRADINPSGSVPLKHITIVPSVPPGNSTDNLIRDGSFESGDIQTWDDDSWGVSLTNTSAYTGNYGCRLTPAGSLRQQLVTKPGMRYRLSGKVRIDREIQKPNWGGIKMEVYDENWKSLGTSRELSLKNATGGHWNTIEMSFTASSSFVRFEFKSFTDGKFDVSADDFVLVEDRTPTPIVTSVKTPVPISPESIVKDGGFESGVLAYWGEDSWGITITPHSAFSGQNGCLISGSGSLRQKLATEPGQKYRVKARVRIDKEITKPSWGGIKLEAFGEQWKSLGASKEYHANNTTQGKWNLVEFSFTASSSTTILEYKSFTDGKFNASADDFTVTKVSE